MAHWVGMPRFLPLSLSLFLSLSFVSFLFFSQPFLSLSLNVVLPYSRQHIFDPFSFFFFSPFQWSFTSPPRPANDTLRVSLFLRSPRTEHEYEISEHEAPRHSLPFSSDNSAFLRYARYVHRPSRVKPPPSPGRLYLDASKRRAGSGISKSGLNSCESCCGNSSTLEVCARTKRGRVGFPKISRSSKISETRLPLLELLDNAV